MCSNVDNSDQCNLKGILSRSSLGCKNLIHYEVSQPSPCYLQRQHSMIGTKLNKTDKFIQKCKDV